MSVGTGSQIKETKSNLPRFEGRCLRQTQARSDEQEVAKEQEIAKFSIFNDKMKKRLLDIWDVLRQDIKKEHSLLGDL